MLRGQGSGRLPRSDTRIGLAAESRIFGTMLDLNQLQVQEIQERTTLLIAEFPNILKRYINDKHRRGLHSGYFLQVACLSPERQPRKEDGHPAVASSCYSCYFFYLADVRAVSVVLTFYGEGVAHEVK